MKSVARRYLSPRQKMLVMQRQDFRCKCCGDPLGSDPRDIEFDHVIELWNGGTNDIDNFAALIKRHHLKKSRDQTKARAKTKRLEAQGGRKKMTVADRALAKMISQGEAR